MKQPLKNTWTILDKKEKRQFVTYILLGIIISMADILALITLLWIIDFYIQPAGNNMTTFLPGWLADKESMALIALFFILFAVKNSAGFLLAKAQYDFTGRVATRISRNKLARFQHSGYTDFVHTDSSVLIREIAFRPFEFAQHVLAGLQQIITQVFLIVISILAIFIFNARLFLLLLIILLPPVILVFYLIRRRLGTTRKELSDSNERSYQYLLDALKGYAEANIYQRNDFFLERFVTKRRQFSSHLFNSLSIQALPSRLIEIFAVLGLFILLLIAKSSGNDDGSTLLTIGAFMAAAYKIIPGMVKVINLAGQIRAYDFLADELSVTGNDEQNSFTAGADSEIHSLELRNISFQYQDRNILDNVSFSVAKGDLAGISGISGKGKTTLLNLLLGFLSPGSGTIFINGKQTDAAAIKQYRPSVSCVRQQPFFIYDTILRNITLDDKPHDPERLAFALKVSGLDKLLATFPEGLEKMITENGRNISGGQQQRIAIARALYKKAGLVLLDEPFNELDEPSVQLMLEHFREIAKDSIVILVTHDTKCLSSCTKIISLDEQG